MDMRSGSSFVTLTTTSRCPDSTAVSTANTDASSSSGTPIVASRTGRPAAPLPVETSVPRSLVSTPIGSLGVQLPVREAPGPSPDLLAPPRHVNQEPEGHQREDDRQDAPNVHVGQDDRRPDAEHQRHPDDLKAVAPHLPHDPPVLLGRDLLGVPPAPAVGTRPPLPVRDAFHPTAVASDGDRGAAHRADCIPRAHRPVLNARTQSAIPLAGVRADALGGGSPWPRPSSRNDSSSSHSTGTTGSSSRCASLRSSSDRSGSPWPRSARGGRSCSGASRPPSGCSRTSSTPRPP